ncbi:MAG TPA: DUF3810 domain-containing protein [Flavobacteriia bacterium]|nr:DUF3810 domain-containing protein [Flavobacteriia bacterium]
MQKWHKIATLFLGVQIIFVYYLRKHPVFVETYYSNGIYPYIASFLRFLFGWIPFSVGDIFYFLVGIWLVYKVIRFVKSRAKNWKYSFFHFTAIISIIYFLFHLLWGFNYYRLPIQENLNLPLKKYTIEDLTLVTEKLLINVQETHFKLTNNDTIPVVINLPLTELFTASDVAYSKLAKKYPQLNYPYGKVKKSLYSLPLSYMGFSGYLNPFTNEAQVNYLVPKYDIPIIATHEIAHQVGYAKESDANFIGYLACIHSKDILLEYSANLMALNYCLNAIYYSDKEIYKEMVNRIPKGVQLNYQENRKFWHLYKNPLEPYFKNFYDLFLKSNNQHFGIKSYSKIVRLLIAYDKKESQK